MSRHDVKSATSGIPFLLEQLSRRTFIKTLAGTAVTVNILPLAATVAEAAQRFVPEAINGNLEPPQENPGWMGPPGQANYRIDGLAKVTGQKIYARDYHASDMPGWPDHEQPVMIIRATDVNHVFSGLDLNLLPAGCKPANVIYGEQLEAGVRLVNTINHDVLLDSIINRLQKSAMGKGSAHLQSIDLPNDFQWPFIVPRGKGADFYGQPVAFLMFADRRSWLGAKKVIQFNPAFQRYGNPVTPPSIPPLSPLTHYVRIAGSGSQDVFSYAQNGGDSDYVKQAELYTTQIKNTIDQNVKNGIWKAYAADFSMQAMDPMFMEPETGIAWYDAANQALNILVGTQSPDGDVNTLLGMFDSKHPPIKVETVNLYSCYPGGGFGGRDSSVFTLNLGIAAAFAGGNPVRLAYDRFEQFQCGLKRHACTGNEQLAFDKTGRLQALVNTMQFDSGGRRNLSPYVAQLAGVCAGGSYDIPQSTIFSEALYSTNVSAGSQRGFGGPQAYLIIETLMDEAATDLGMDPFALRRANLLKTGDKTVVGGPITQSLQLAAILDKAQADPIWVSREADKARWQKEGLHYGVGFAMSNQAYGTSGDGVLAAVSIDAKGHFTVRTNAVDMGNGSATTLAISIASALGANASEVETGNPSLWDALNMQTGSSGSWSNNKWTRSSVGSSSACLTGFHQVHAAMQAAGILFQLGLFPAAKVLWGSAADNLKPEQTAWQKGNLTVPDTNLPALSQQQLAQQILSTDGISGVLAHAYFQQDWAKGSFTIQGKHYTWPVDGLALAVGRTQAFIPLYRDSVAPPPAAASRYVRTAFAPCGNLVGVTVDTRTGEVILRASASFLNAGKVICEELVSGQSQGGVAMATGWALLENMPPGPAGPASGDWNLNRYYVAKASNVPLDQRLITLPPDDGEITGRGIAEAVMCSVAPAISNAIFAAIGKRFRDLPITAEKVRGALHG